MVNILFINLSEKISVEFFLNIQVLEVTIKNYDFSTTYKIIFKFS